jgi:Tfp pilus assembly protein PilN
VNSLPSRQSRRSHLKQILLFGISVFLPAAVLLLFTLRINRQDNELRKRRAAEARQQKAEEIGQHMADRLEHEEQAIMKELSADSSLIRETRLARSELAFVGRI